MRLPKISQQPVGEYALGNIRQPNVMGRAEAMQGLIRQGADTAVDVYNRNADTQLSQATAAASKELSELRMKLETSNTIPADEVPSQYADATNPLTYIGKDGDRQELDNPMIFTHEVADEWWADRSNEIIEHYGSSIRSKEARAKFNEEMQTRYIGPGTLAIGQSSAIKARAHNQAIAEGAIRDVLASMGPSKERESQAREIIARQFALGASPQWVSDHLAAIGPRIDQIDVQNAIMAAGDADSIDLVIEEMWAGGTRMTPEQMRTMGVQADKRKADMEVDHKKVQTENADNMFAAFINNDLTLATVGNAVQRDAITKESGWTLYNAMTSGTSTKVSNPRVLSNIREEIIKIPYTGGADSVRARGQMLKAKIQGGVMGLNDNGTPNDSGATISGTDAQKLIEEIDKKVSEGTRRPDYTSAVTLLKGASNVKDVFGSLEGNQPNINAYIEFKKALDTYMDTYGVDADPVSFFNTNRENFRPELYENDSNSSFISEVPQAKRFMEESVNGLLQEYTFTQVQQAQFVRWLAESVTNGTVSEEEGERISALFLALYRGRGIPPNGGALQFPATSPYYQWGDAE